MATQKYKRTQRACREKVKEVRNRRNIKENMSRAEAYAKTLVGIREIKEESESENDIYSDVPVIQEPTIKEESTGTYIQRQLRILKEEIFEKQWSIVRN